MPSMRGLKKKKNQRIRSTEWTGLGSGSNGRVFGVDEIISPFGPLTQVKRHKKGRTKTLLGEVKASDLAPDRTGDSCVGQISVLVMIAGLRSPLVWSRRLGSRGSRGSAGSVYSQTQVTIKIMPCLWARIERGTGDLLLMLHTSCDVRADSEWRTFVTLKKSLRYNFEIPRPQIPSTKLLSESPWMIVVTWMTIQYREPQGPQVPWLASGCLMREERRGSPPADVPGAEGPLTISVGGRRKGCGVARDDGSWKGHIGQMEIWLDSGFSGQQTIVVIEDEYQCYTSPFQNSVSSYRLSKDLNCMCQAFGGARLAAFLDPITRRHP
ncbi:hypothetical protein B0H13DRAFT_1862071 [Mycena leptocephala]|nr:hypothetical protein B0H13DRAFT_1862071 [Mycena leptocephala]